MNFEQFFIASSDQDAKLTGTISAHTSEVAPDILETVECEYEVTLHFVLVHLFRYLTNTYTRFWLTYGLSTNFSHN